MQVLINVQFQCSLLMRVVAVVFVLTEEVQGEAVVLVVITKQNYYLINLSTKRISVNQ